MCVNNMSRGEDRKCTYIDKHEIGVAAVLSCASFYLLTERPYATHSVRCIGA